MNRLRLLERDGGEARPAGLILGRHLIADAATRLARRARHYAALRVTASRNSLIFWSTANDVPLPWFDEEPVYLAQRDKIVFFPADRTLDLPDKWSERILDRLAGKNGLSRPILLLPVGGELTAIGLGANSVPVPAVDWERLAAL
jgi:hypothetical protein